MRLNDKGSFSVELLVSFKFIFIIMVVIIFKTVIFYSERRNEMIYEESYLYKHIRILDMLNKSIIAEEVVNILDEK